MAKYTKPSDINEVWASEAPSENIIKPSLSQSVPFTVVDGWTQIKPPFENENWVQNQQSQFAAYLNQLGIPEWDSNTEYQANQSYVQGSDNKVYKAIVTHTNRNPAQSANSSFWEETSLTRLATDSKAGIVELATAQETQDGLRDDVAVTPEGINGIVESQLDGIVEVSLAKLYFYGQF